MKNAVIYRRVVALVVVLPTIAQAALLIEDHFAYSSGNLGGQGGWISYGGVGSQIQVQSGNLSISGLAASSGSELALGGAGQAAYRTYSSQSSGSVYFSFILQVTTVPGSGTEGAIAGLGNTSGTPGPMISIRNSSGTTSLGISANLGATTFGGTSLSDGSTVLVVGMYQFVSGANNDVVKLWVAPSSSTFGGSDPAANVTLTGSVNSDVTELAEFDWYRSANVNGIVDELRVGQSWADVTPVPESNAWGWAGGLGLAGLIVGRAGLRRRASSRG